MKKRKSYLSSDMMVLCDICAHNEATHHYPGFVYEDVCDSCHDQPTLWFPDKPYDLETAMRLMKAGQLTLQAFVKVGT